MTADTLESFTNEIRQSLAAIKARIEQDLNHLHQGLAKLDRHSSEPDDRWTVDLYQRLIARRTSVLQTLFPNP